MTEEELSSYFFKATENIGEATLELYEALHPLGCPQTEMNNKVGGLLKAYMNAVGSEVEFIRESIKEYNGQ